MQCQIPTFSLLTKQWMNKCEGCQRFRQILVCWDVCCFMWTSISLQILHFYCILCFTSMSKSSLVWWSHTRSSLGRNQWFSSREFPFPSGQLITLLCNFMPDSFFCISDLWPKRNPAHASSLKFCIWPSSLLPVAINIISTPTFHDTQHCYRWGWW